MHGARVQSSSWFQVFWLENSGTGYIGSFTTVALIEAGYKVVIVDNLYNSSEEVINRIELLTGTRPAYHTVDITDETALDKVFAAHPDVDSVIHFAALKVGDRLILAIWGVNKDFPLNLNHS